MLDETGGRGTALEEGTEAAPKSMPGAELSTGAGSRLAGSALAAGAALTASGACATGAAMEMAEDRRIRKVDLTNIVQKVCGRLKVNKKESLAFPKSEIGVRRPGLKSV